MYKVLSGRNYSLKEMETKKGENKKGRGGLRVRKELLSERDGNQFITTASEVSPPGQEGTTL